MRIAFLGDISLNNDYNDMYRKGINPFQEIYEELKKYDYVVGNLENSCKGTKLSNKPLPKLSTNSETLNYLSNIPVNILSLANNHIGDNYERGFERTIDKLNSIGISYLGAGYEHENIVRPLILQDKSTSIALFNYYGKDFERSVPVDSKILLNYYNKDKILKDIKEYKLRVEYVIILIHWGAKVEGGYYPDYYMYKDSKDFIYAGCDLIIGHHSHTFQPYEKINNRYVFYSLGNFCFSNYEFNGVKKYLDNRGLKSGIPIFEINKHTIQLHKIIYVKNRLTRIEILRRRPFIYNLNQLLLNIFKKYPFWKIYYFYHKRIDWFFKLIFRTTKPAELILKDLLNKRMINRGILKLFSNK